MQINPKVSSPKSYCPETFFLKVELQQGDIQEDRDLQSCSGDRLRWWRQCPG